MRRTHFVVLAAAVLVVAAQAPLAAAPTNPTLASRTVLSAENSTRFSVEVAPGTVVDVGLDTTEGGMPRALQVAGGSGFVGFVLQAAGGQGATVTALKLPTPDLLEDGGTGAGVGWGRSADGTSCTRCDLPAGVYNLYLIAGDAGSDSVPATVTVKIGDGTDTLALGDDEGTPHRVRQQTDPAMTGPNNPIAPVVGYSGGFWERSGAEFPKGARAIVVDQMTFTLRAGAAPPLAGVVEFCRRLGGPQECSFAPVPPGGGTVGRSQVNMFTRGDDQPGVQVGWDVVGDARWEVQNNAVWIALD